MDTQQIVSAITAERDRLNQVLELLTGGTVTPIKRRGRPRKASNMPDWVSNGAAAPAKPARKKRTFTAAQRLAASKRFKAMWKAKKAAAKKTTKRTAKKAVAATQSE